METENIECADDITDALTEDIKKPTPLEIDYEKLKGVKITTINWG